MIIFIMEKPEDPQIEPHAGIRMTRGLVSPSSISVGTLDKQGHKNFCCGAYMLILVSYLSLKKIKNFLIICALHKNVFNDCTGCSTCSLNVCMQSLYHSISSKVQLQR